MVRVCTSVNCVCIRVVSEYMPVCLIVSANMSAIHSVCLSLFTNLRPYMRIHVS